MSQKSKVINIALLAVWCFSLLTNVSLAAVSPEELQKIEAAVPAKATAEPAQPRKLLVFTLTKGYKHSSIPYATRALEIMGKKTGAFEVVQSRDMSIFKPENLKQFDAVCFNNTSKLKFKDRALRKSLMDFVKSGKGVVGIHAVADSFYNWPEAAEMMGGLFDGHPWGAKGTWAVKLDEPNHPLNKAFGGEGFLINDEIYQFKEPYSRDKLCVLLSLETCERNLKVKGTGSYGKMHRKDNDYAISWVRGYGKGRVFYCSLGHRKEIFWNPAVLRYYLDGVQFALGDLPVDTTPSGLNLPALEESLAEIATYEYGQSREPLTALSDFVRSKYGCSRSLKRIEKRLLEFLRSDATLAGKQFICRQLSIIGTEEAVPTLSAMLTETATSDMAGYALERIPGAAVDRALRKALQKTTGKTKVGIINSLGRRRDSNSAAALGGLIYNSEPTIAAAAVAALGQIADSQATDALAKAKEQTGGKLRLLVLDAYLNCADQLAARGERPGALAIYRQLYATSEPVPIRIAALRGIVVTAVENEAVGIVVDILKGDDSEMQVAAIGLVREIPGTRTIKAVTAELPNLSVARQVQLLSELAGRGDKVALPAVIKAAKTPDESVRIAALEALGQLGNASSVMVLAQAAAKTQGAEQKAARESLYRLRGLTAEQAIKIGGVTVDNVILNNIPKAEPKVKVELIRSISRRHVYTATETLLKTAQDTDSNVRLESVKVLRDIAGPEHISALVELLLSVKSETERKEAEKTVASVAQKISDRNRQAEPILAVLGSVKDVASRCSLLNVLGKIGADASFAVLRAALGEQDIKVREASIRALSNWPTAEPAAELLKVVQSSENETHRVLALRGFVRLIGLDSGRPVKETIKMYSQAMGLASNASEKKMVLSALAGIKALAALEMAADYLEDKTLQQEAEFAVVKIARTIYGDHPEQTRAVLEKVIRISENDSLRQQAQRIIDKLRK